MQKFEIIARNENHFNLIVKELERLGITPWDEHHNYALYKGYRYIRNGSDNKKFSFGYKENISHSRLTLDDLATMPTPKEMETVTWHQVTSHEKDDDVVYRHEELFKSKEHFLKFVSGQEEDFHFIELKEVMTHEYEVKNV